MLQSTFMDMVLGLDIHFEMVPMPAPVPTPLPNPFVGMVFDPGGLLVGQAMGLAMALLTGKAPKGPVLVNSMPATTCGTNAKNSLGVPHILMPPGTAWAPMPKLPKPAIKGPPPPPGPPVAPEGDAISVFGSLTVSFMGSSAVRMGDKSMSCGEPVRLPSSTVLAIPKGLPVMTGGPPALSISDAIGALLKSKWIAGYLHDLLSRLSPGRLRNILSKVVCFVTGHPVDVATGRVLTDHLEWELPGPLPLKFERNYASSWANRAGPLGHGWSHSLDQAVWGERGRVVYLNAEGQELEFDTFDCPDHVLPPGRSVFDPISRLTLTSLGQRRFEIAAPDGIVHEFAPVEGAVGNRKWWSRLVRKRARDGATIEFDYDRRGNLEWVRDSARRGISLEHDGGGRLVAVKLPHPTQQGWQIHTRYTYDEAGDLVAVTDPLGHSWRFAYKQHLLVQETNRNGLSFYFAYDGFGEDAYCVRTWGDGGIYDHVIDYDKMGKATYVTNSLGQTTTYKMNVVGCVVEVMDAVGASTKYEYDERTLRKVKETNPVGGETKWDYDERGNLVQLTQPNETVLSFVYGAGDRLVGTRDLSGGEWRWEYDRYGRVTVRVDPLGRRTLFHYDGAFLSGTIDPAGRRLRLVRDEAGNIVRAMAPGGRETRWDFDRLGRCVKMAGLTGQVQARHCDPLGRVVQIDEPNGLVRMFEYDPEGNVVRARDGVRDVAFRYAGTRWRSKIVQGGNSVSFHYDSEGNLVAVENEKAARYSFRRGPTGQVDEEVDFGGVSRRFFRDPLGRVSRVLLPDSSETKYRHDPLGRLIAIEHSKGGGAAFKYGADGKLVEAVNEHSKIKFERDPLGRVTREIQGDEWIQSSYDLVGNRDSISSSRGLRQKIGRNDVGDVISVAAETLAGGRFDVAFDRDTFGLELKRQLPGGLSSVWERDVLGRPKARQVVRDGQSVEAEQYLWGKDHRLEMVIDAFQGPVKYEHDEMGNLVSAQYHGEHPVLRLTDEAGRLYRSESKEDRLYGPAGQLVESRDPEGITRYEYDKLGNLVRKIAPDDRVWLYEWNAGSMLSRVLRPNGISVELRYDALGRRIWKKAGNRVTRWMWDRDVPLHEWFERVPGLDEPAPRAARSDDDGIAALRDAGLTPRSAQGPPGANPARQSDEPITWIFEPESFAPLCKLVGGEAFSVISDHRGVPISMYDARARRVWSAQVDVYGGVRSLAGDREMCPFRWPGQWDDVDTGLSLNRFRHYDPEMGTFISPDPLRIMGGTRPYAHVADPLRMQDVYGLNPADLALGLSNKRVTVDTPNGPITGTQTGVLQDFAKDPVGDGSIRATTWTGLDPVTDANGIMDLEQTITKGMDDAERIHFNVEGMTNWKDICKDADPSKFAPPSTNWELATVMSDAELKQKTQLYDGPGNPVKCG